MRCEFETTGTIENRRAVCVLMIACFLTAAISTSPHFPDSLAVVFVILFILSVLLLIALSLLKGGVIRARGKQVIISHNFLDGNAFVSYIGYNEITYAEYHVESLRRGYSFYGYSLSLTINKKSGKKVTLSKSLDIEKNFPTENPDEYKEFLKEQPLVKMCKYINERARVL